MGDFVVADRDHFVLATKYGNSWTGGVTQAGNSRRNMMMSVERSLRQLRTDRIDLFWLHVWDYTTGIDEVMRAFDDLVRSGKVLYVGRSDTPAWEIARSNMMADLMGMTPIVAIQIARSLLERGGDHDLMPMARALDLAVTAWAPLAAGLLARPSNAWRETRRQSPSSLPGRDRQIIDKMNEVAAVHDVAPAAIALAALMYHATDQQVFPILGATKPDQLRSALRAQNVQLSQSDWEELESLSKPEKIFPYSLIDTEMGRRVTSGGEPDRLIRRDLTGFSR